MGKPVLTDVFGRAPKNPLRGLLATLPANVLVVNRFLRKYVSVVLDLR